MGEEGISWQLLTAGAEQELLVPSGDQESTAGKRVELHQGMFTGDIQGTLRVDILGGHSEWTFRVDIQRTFRVDIQGTFRVDVQSGHSEWTLSLRGWLVTGIGSPQP
ncbi:hypothetical protein HGM15179_017342 [Zosterops borbonicus]|uniref:Uncharacterized protein n=1 Tax=Zosterops borbonicus TaxID=364589 RepID=A0A8K1G0Z7_9PASS|nr:hypothetical protein HGM15179_017342 [Zosterops borbonicus]